MSTWRATKRRYGQAEQLISEACTLGNFSHEAELAALDDRRRLLFAWSAMECVLPLYELFASPRETEDFHVWCTEVRAAAAEDRAVSVQVLDGLLGRLWPEDPEEEEEVDLFTPQFHKYALLRVTRLFRSDIGDEDVREAASSAAHVLLEELGSVYGTIAQADPVAADLEVEQDAAFAPVLAAAALPHWEQAAAEVEQPTRERQHYLRSTVAPAWLAAAGWTAEQLDEPRRP